MDSTRRLTLRGGSGEYEQPLEPRRASRKVTSMKWETPSFVEINMSAEIGGYHSDFSDRDPWGPPAPRTDETGALLVCITLTSMASAGTI